MPPPRGSGGVENNLAKQVGGSAAKVAMTLKKQASREVTPHTTPRALPDAAAPPDAAAADATVHDQSQPHVKALLDDASSASAKVQMSAAQQNSAYLRMTDRTRELMQRLDKASTARAELASAVRDTESGLLAQLHASFKDELEEASGSGVMPAPAGSGSAAGFVRRLDVLGERSESVRRAADELDERMRRAQERHERLQRELTALKEQYDARPYVENAEPLPGRKKWSSPDQQPPVPRLEPSAAAPRPSRADTPSNIAQPLRPAVQRQRVPRPTPPEKEEGSGAPTRPKIQAAAHVAEDKPAAGERRSSYLIRTQRRESAHTDAAGSRASPRSGARDALHASQQVQARATLKAPRSGADGDSHGGGQTAA